jgi:UDP:flavonoid glycosyltransferase YjiC (YdhE family)
MSRFLFAMWEGGGTVPPEIGVAGRLIRRDHQVHVIGDPTIEMPAQRVGASFTAWRDAPHVTSLRPEDALVRDWEIRNPFKLFAALRDALLCRPTRLFARETLAAIEAFQPDVVAPDMVLIGAMIAAEKAGMPQAVLVPNLYPFPSKGRPMIGSGSMPATGPIGRLRDTVNAAIFRRLFDSGLPPVNQTRVALGLAPLSHTFDQHGRAERMLLLSSEAFDFPGPPLPANVVYVGAQLDDPPWADEWVSPWGVEDKRPLVLVGFSSTFQDQGLVLERVAQAFAGLPVRGLITAGPALVGSRIAAPDNVVVVASAPHGQLIPQASVVVSHCGHGTALKALSYGVPLLCMPMGRDQGDNAARAVWHGAGIRLEPSASPAVITTALQQLISDNRYKNAARALAARMKGESSRDRAVEELERLALLSRRAAPATGV